MAFAILITLMNVYMIWRLVYDWLLTDEMEKQGKKWEIIILIFTISLICICFISLITYLMIIPAIYEDLKDNKFLTLSADRNAW